MQKKSYDRENQKPVLKCNIPVGQQMAGFKNIHTGKFEEVMVIRDGTDLDLFMEMYDVSTIIKEY